MVPIGGQHQGELTGNADRAVHFQQGSGARHIADRAINGTAAELDRSGLQDAVPRHNPFFIHGVALDSLCPTLSNRNQSERTRAYKRYFKGESLPTRVRTHGAPLLKRHLSRPREFGSFPPTQASLTVSKPIPAKRCPGIDQEPDEMPSGNERRELVPVIVAGLVAAIGAFCLWSDLKNDALDRGDGMVTSAVVSRAGATITPSEPPTHLVVPQTVPSH
jgi:hypothetical protein